jgi:hypothetical protein
MPYNSVEDIMTVGRISFEDFTQSEIEKSITSAQSEIDLLIPPLIEGQRGYDRYARRLPLVKEAHGYLTLSYLYRVKLYDEAARGQSSDALNVPGIGLGPHTPEKNVQTDLYLKLADSYREQAENLIKRCRYRIPVARRPRPLEL